ncbi:MAG: circadian clock protein KaiC [Ignavibacteriaceae bacterium]
MKKLIKAPTGISGFDEITFGGLPEGRPTLICGSAGCGKTLFAIEFIVKGAVLYKEPGVLVSFEEAPNELIQNVASLGFDLPKLIKQKLISIDYIRVDKNEIEETGEFNLDGLFIRLEYIINSIGAKRIALDTIESLFSGISNHAILRAELVRLFRWLKDKGITAVITGEKGENTLTRHGLEEYVSDCVIYLDNRITEQFSTRRLRVIKYRGSSHGMNEYPFLINEDGISVLPISSLRLKHEASRERISTGVKGLDEMMGGKGYYRGSTVLVSGTAGAGKSSLLAHFINETCSRGEKCLYVAYEESEEQIKRNMKSIGINLSQWEDKGLLKFHVIRPTYYSLEMHLAIIHKITNEFEPRGVVIDPISNLTTIATINETNSLLTRLIDFFKVKKITTLFSNLVNGGTSIERTDVGVSSLVDTWILLFDMEANGERNRAIYILKSRGMEHSRQMREFVLSSKGIKLIDVYVSKEGILIGSARVAREALDNHMLEQRKEEKHALELNISKIRKAAEAKIEAIRSEYEAQVIEMEKSLSLTHIEEDRTRIVLKEEAVKRQNINKKFSKGDRNGKKSG